MSDTFNDTFREYYRARLEPTDFQVEIVPGSVMPVKLSLGLPTGATLKTALATPPNGAILALDMTAETAARLFVQIRNVLREMNWTLPEETKK